MIWQSCYAMGWEYGQARGLVDWVEHGSAVHGPCVIRT